MKTLIILAASILTLSGNRLIEVQSLSHPPEDHEMVLIRGGSFIMGVAPRPGQKFIHNRDHEVTLSSFYIDKYEVTNAQYHAFCQATGHRLPEFWDMDAFRSGLSYPDDPVVGVTWQDAMAYASWKGYRLPTEAEWEFAARGGLEGMMFPGGDELNPDLGNYHTTNGHTLPVGSFPPNGYGLYDMAGNVVEWVNDWYDKDYYLNSPEQNPLGPEAGFRRCIRGGGWRSGKSCCSVYFRQSLRPHWVDFNVGFRCAKDAE